jgi:hypothetical protein
MFESFDVLSGDVYFVHKFGDSEDWILEREKFDSSTSVWMNLDNHTSRTMKKSLDQYTGDDFGFGKTVVPVKLAQYRNDKLISRLQAKRLVSRVELFKTVIFNFEGVETIGQAFADEIFRVFEAAHPEMQILSSNGNSAIKRMLARAKGGAIDEISPETAKSKGE